MFKIAIILDMTSSNKLSLFIITKNSAETLPACLESVQGLADEIIVVDSFSEDDTVKTAKQYGAKTWQRPFTGFQDQKQFALDQCTGDWVLSLDSDEALTPELKEEIRKTISKKQKHSIFLIPEMVTFLGRKMKHSGLTGKLHERLGKGTEVYFTGGLVHERLASKGSMGRLKNYFLHTPYSSLENYFDKFNKYTTMGAKNLYDAGKKFRYFNLFRQPVDFLKFYILRLGILDSWQGFIWAWLSSTYPTVKYIKLWFLEYKNKCK